MKIELVYLSADSRESLHGMESMEMGRGKRKKTLYIKGINKEIPY